MGAPAIFEKQIEIKLLHPASTLESRIQVEVCLLMQYSVVPNVLCSVFNAIKKANP
ncbi:MAG: hypothetical protein P8X79_18450 [Reinekea sp.]